MLIGSSEARTPGPQASVKPPKLTIEVTHSSVILQGAISSVAHESILRQRALKLFPDKKRTFDLAQHPVLPPGWALVSEISLITVAESYSSYTEVSRTSIDIRGITSTISAWPDKIAHLQKVLLPGMQIKNQMVQIGTPTPLHQQCVRLFREALNRQKIEFPRSGYTLGSNAYPLLDRMVQISADCPGAHIRLVGHTDNTGEEPGNVALSQARADTIAAYLTTHGVAQERITASGLGSAQPVAPGNSTQDHKLNRRIDVDLVFPGN